MRFKEQTTRLQYVRFTFSIPRLHDDTEIHLYSNNSLISISRLHNSRTRWCQNKNKNTQDATS